MVCICMILRSVDAYDRTGTYRYVLRISICTGVVQVLIVVHMHTFTGIYTFVIVNNYVRLLQSRVYRYDRITSSRVYNLN